MSEKTKEQVPSMPHKIRFLKSAYDKLQYLCLKGQTEIGGFGISSEHDPLLVIDFLMVKQKANACFVEFDPDDLNAHMMRCLDKGIMPNRCMRIWIHTHPGSSAAPSNVDEKCLIEEFGAADWSVMFIMARTGTCSCRLKVNNGAFQMSSELKVEIVADNPMREEWDAEYDANWSPIIPEPVAKWSGAIQPLYGQDYENRKALLLADKKEADLMESEEEFIKKRTKATKRKTEPSKEDLKRWAEEKSMFEEEEIDWQEAQMLEEGGYYGTNPK